VAQLKELRELRLQGGKPTTEGFRRLRGNTNLCYVRFACLFDLPGGMLSEAANLPQLRQLSLYGASAASSEYASLVKATNLVDLQITYARNFGDADFYRLTNLPCLQNLVVRSESLTAGSADLLPQFRALTNVDLAGWTRRTSWRTNWPAPNRAQQEAR